MQGHELYSLSVDGKPHLIPKPPDRVELIKLTHEETGSTVYSGVTAEVVADQGSRREWKDKSAALLVDTLINHRQTSASHPQANGLAE